MTTDTRGGGVARREGTRHSYRASFRHASLVRVQKSEDLISPQKSNFISRKFLASAMPDRVLGFLCEERLRTGYGPWTKR